jgi:hypothetical protein
MLEITFQYCHTLVTGHWWWFPPPGLDPHGTELPRGSQCGREEEGCELVVMHLFRYRTDTGPLVGNMFGEYWGHCKLRNSLEFQKRVGAMCILATTEDCIFRCYISYLAFHTFLVAVKIVIFVWFLYDHKKVFFCHCHRPSVDRMVSVW